MIETFLTLPEGLSQLSFWVLMATSFIASLITVALGIGGGGLLLAVMATLVPPAALIPVHGVVQLGSNGGRAAMLFRQISWAAVIPGFLIGSLVGSAIGGAVVVELPPNVVQIGVGLFVIYSVFAKPPKWLSRWPWLTGGVSSFLTMFFGATGLFVANYTKSFNLPRHAHVATHAALMTVQHGLKVVIFGLLGFAFGQWAMVILALILAGLAGTFLGKTVLNKMTDGVFKIALDVILVLISLRLIWQGLTG
ncbi:sulfite exporter TauE/SafE family protein [Roseicyclus persicicus]|uniref:Probable membrane transporter protein n=1 Tax=Roseicyclus persicicus TaxID=2650661 RepID=A0A7X6H0A7_9RHOB|nr:sulfite exporter TauE/SafE family protein [Roseibacterium persicicum]NKX44531.1 sulfite exporter TauE/SafE family protein [Roseibacterium persicicum]